METLLLKTKLNIPPARPGTVPRPRLKERIHKSINFSLTLVSAPAGFGKTTLVSEWARQNLQRLQVAWVSLDEGDNDPIRFWDYFIAAVKTLQPDLGEKVLTWLHSPQLLPVEGLMTVLINELTIIPFDFIVVLDDYHYISSPTVHNGMTYLLEHIPPRLHLIIASRVDPPLPLVYFRGKGTMLEIGADELRFTLEDAIALFREMHGPKLTARDISALNSRTEGWAVGLKMAALSLRGTWDIPKFITSFTGSQRYIMDYLIEEVLRKQSPEVQDFLLKTSILERITAPLCDVVTGRDDSHNMLFKIERENLFIVPLDESRQWYRYEHLFAELLHHQLEIASGIKAIEELHRLASQWYEDNKLPDEAINHALVARDWERAMRLISLPEVSMPRRISMTMLKWLEAIPRELLLKNERLRSLYLWELMVAGQYEAAEPILKNLEQLAPDNKPLQGEVALARAQMSYNTVNAEKYAKEALSLLPAGNIASRGVANMILGINYVNRGLFNEAEPILREAYESLQRVGMIAVASSPLTFLGIITMLRGKFHQAEKIYRQAIDIAGPSSLAGLAHMYYSYLYLEWNELEAAEFEMDKALELVTFLSTHAQGVAYHYMTRIQLARGDIEGANTSLERADRILSEKEAPPADRARNAAFHVLFAREQRDAKSVSIWLDKLSEYEEFFPVDIPLNAVYLLFGRKSRTAALERLSSDYERFKKDGLNYYAMGARLAQVVYSTKPEPALTYLAEVLHTGRTEGFIRIFLESGIEFAPLLHQAIARGIETEYAQKLLNIIEFEEERRKLRTITPVRDILSERELEVLRLIAIGLSNKDIAGKLVISLNTTKTHIRHLFDKLEVKGRTRAIARAKELKLI